MGLMKGHLLTLRDDCAIRDDKIPTLVEYIDSLMRLMHIPKHVGVHDIHTCSPQFSQEIGP